MKRIITMLLTLAMLVSIGVTPAFAVNEEVSEAMDEISSLLASIEQSKDAWDLSEVDFSNLRVGNPIYSYIYSDDSFQANDRIYPISEDGQLLLLAVDHDGTISITTQFVKEITAAIGPNEPFSIVYDRIGCYACTDSSSILLTENTDGEIDSRSVLPHNNTSFSENLPLVALSDDYLAPHKEAAPYAMEDYNYSLSVPFVNQLPNQYICWAACVASIVNFTTGNRLTAQDVVRKLYGNDYNQTLTVKEIPALLNSYGLNYQPRIVFPSDYRIYINLLEGYPLYSDWYRTDGISGGHACVIFGIDSQYGRLSLMDPWGGIRATASFDGYDYNYYCVGAARSYKLSCAVLHVYE